MPWLSPSRSQRVDLSKKCPRCFLIPSEMKFPICDKNCEIDCAGVHAAYVRAREWKYSDVAAKAEKILEKSCGKIVNHLTGRVIIKGGATHRFLSHLH